jgi:hypothetical protein
MFELWKDMNIFRKEKNKTKANGPNPLVAQWHSTGVAGLHSTRAAHNPTGLASRSGPRPCGTAA